MEQANLQELCDLWRYQHTECRLTEFLKQKIDGYDNGIIYDVARAAKQRQQWLTKSKFSKDTKQQDQITKVKEKYLYQLLHPEEIYMHQKKQWEITKQPYGKNNPLFKSYQSVTKYNLRPNIVDFKLYCEVQTQNQRQNKKHFDYVKTFHQKFGDVLEKHSPQFWKLLMFDLLDRVQRCRGRPNQDLFNQLNTVLPGENNAIKYLITFRKQIQVILRDSKFTEKVENLKLQSSQNKPKKKQKQTKEQLNKWLKQDNQEQLDSIDFVKLKDYELIQKVPTLKRYDHAEYIQFKIEPLPRMNTDHIEKIKVSDFTDDVYGKCFESEYLNTLQSAVFDHAFNSNENMLVCAPTGAGKTNIATLAILQAIKCAGSYEDVKIVYISPMKALANQLVAKFSTKLPHMKTRQSTGDIQLSQRQLATTNILVTTPQKWDVTTRKGTSMLENVHLIILDQVHLLNDERGWVIESIVARLFRTQERTQRHIRLVGLSATLPNYYDVADFLKVDRTKGLFHFDSNYRPVPLLINFVGIKNPKDSTNNLSKKRNIRDLYNQKCYQMTLNYLKADKQVLIFVHSRRQTVKYCEYMIERAKQLKDDHIMRHMGGILKNYPGLKDQKLKKIVQDNCGFHHAGMVRTDRNAVQKMFVKGQIKVLLATATLAWGVNMPAYAVIIKGTDIYDPNLTESKNLSILDVQQMFGRAGRPQYDTKGQATLMSDHSKVNHYMGALTNSSPIDSKFLKFLKEALNAEISSGTVTNEDEAFDWLKYTFLAVRLKRCPQIYGCPRGANQTQKEMYFDQFLRSRVNQVLNQLDRMRLIRFDRKNFSVTSTELGRITSHYYIKCQTMEHFCSALHIHTDGQDNYRKKFDYKTQLQLLNVLANCKQFQSIAPRLQEMDQLKSLVKYWILEEQPDFIMKKDRTSVNLDDGPIIDTPQKVMLLMQGYLRDVTYQNFSLINDTQYVIQNSIRFLRCLLDLCSKKNQAENVRTILSWCKYIENRVYKDDSPLRQFTRFSYSGYNAMRARKQFDGFLSPNIFQRFQQKSLSVEDFLACEDDSQRAALLGNKNSNHYMINILKEYCSYVPKLEVEYSIKPIAQTILKIDLTLTPRFRFSSKWHSKSQIFWIMFDDGEQLLHSETITIEEEFIIKRKQVKASFYIRYKGKDDSQYRLTVTSDKWITDYNEEHYLKLEDFGVDTDSTPFTDLLSLEPLPKSALKNPVFQSLYPRFTFFNPIQTQLFFSLYQSDKNILIGAPTGSGKTIMAELAILHLFKSSPQKKIVYVAPLKSLVKQRLKDWVPRMQKIKKSVVQLSGDFTPDIETLNKADIIVTTPQKWDGITRSKDREYTKKVGLVIFDEIHLLGQERGAVLEVIVSRMNKQSKIRMIGLSTAMANGTDVAEWFGADQYGFFNFRPTVRPVPIEIHFEGFSEKHYCPRMGTMNKPAFNHIKKFSDGKPVIIFVSSRRQTRLTANDLISFSQMQNRQSCPYIRCDIKTIQRAVESVHDEYLKQTLTFGIVMHHAGLDNHDRDICEELFVNNKVQVMIATSTLAWGVNFPARLVIIKGTQFFDPKSHKYVDFQATDLLQMIGRAGRPQYDDKGVAMVYCESSKKNFYRKFLNDPFPIQSSLQQQLDDHINAQISRGQINNATDCIQWITWSFMFRRVLKNPSYYGLQGSDNKAIKQWLTDTVKNVFKRLKQSKCIQVYEAQDGETYVMPTQLGFISSMYYLKHVTVNKFHSDLSAGMTFKQILRLLCDAQQFKQTPLRHNQDVHNRQLSDIAPFKAKVYSSPQDKTFLLLQMHFYNLPFPIRDYVNDCKLILDSSGRVIMGMVDVAKEKKLLDATKTSIYIQQAIYQGFGCNIPYITYDIWQKMQKEFSCLAGVVQQYNGRGVDKVLKFLKQNVIQYDERKQKKILQALKSFPVMKFDVKARNFDSEQNIENDKQIEQGGQAMLNVFIQKQNYNVPNRLLVQKHQKIKDVTWWIVVGDNNNNLLGLKKVGVKRKVNIKIQIQVPSNFQKDKVYVYLMADSYIGLDQVQKVSFSK